ncbi:outer membrane murein-binding lipoprotein Lpp [Cryobacterium sp. MP_M5]|uniref:hypothetical protein n=1 Tax=unclassified Cryobacterium TaxID=2649013 RepID=UPI0018CA62FD|nr:MULTISPECIES: hypothetical protein [unclassified Cryobacterium]MBG6057857.1 outer membrane murein-binding lipoprotein Lpp [Cryobacterium sp. MP_M3]MEC5176056.1 outer membrane murein-binding lipoprotein Lpp [Cryobacterium sp. MP_M5]
MRFVSRRRPVMGAMALLGTLALAGCASPARQAPSPTATDAPVFASDAEALAAATEAYAAYQEMSDLILSQGGAEPERIRAVASREFAATEIAGFKQAADNGLHSVGRTSFDGIAIQRTTGSKDGIAAVSVYLCSDVSEVDVLDATGQSVVAETRPARTSFEVTFDRSSLKGPGLVVGAREIWDRGGAC